jgi:hypothetical protein
MFRKKISGCRWLCCLVAVWLTVPVLTTCAQDSTRKKLSIRNISNDVYRNFFVVRPRVADSTYFQRSEESYRPFEGKIIRHIIIRKLPFGENVLDTSQQFMNTVTRIANNLQTGTQDFIVKQLLFVKENQPLSPYRLADNERYLRDLNFIKDARIMVRPVRGAPDSVDVVVRVRDVFSWGGRVDAHGISDFRASVYDANLFGRAQRFQYTMLYDIDRDPRIGSEFLYRKYSAWGSFVNIEAAYTTIDNGVALGDENEIAYYLKLDRPLYTPDARLAGGLEISMNESANRFKRPDSLFRDYKYRLADAWIGYNIGTRRKDKYDDRNRQRQMAAIRFFDQQFIREPTLEYFDPRYVDKTYLLGQFTWYKINFYRTNYIYGFGRTEDMPVGMTRKLIAGYSRVDSVQRLYLGWEYDHMLVDKKGNYWDYTLALGTNYYRGDLQDNSLFFNMSWFSRLYNFNRTKLRQFANISYAGISKLHVYEKLRIDNEFGLPDYNTDSVLGVQRITAGTETSIFTRWQILGFNIGFFTFGKASMITPEGARLLKSDILTAIGGGIRTRNENLIFGTIECKFTFFPRSLYDVNNITLTVSGNLRLKYSGSFVRPPWFAMLR